MNKRVQWNALWHQLAVLLDAGLPVDKALLNFADKQAKALPGLESVIAAVRQGVALASALQREQIISRFDFALIDLAEQAGRLPAGLRAISNRHQLRQQRVKSLRVRLWMPQLVLCIAAVASIFLVLMSGPESLANAIFRAVATVVVVMFVTRLLLAVILLDPRYYLSFFWWSPTIKRHLVLYYSVFEQLFYRGLLWQLESGVDAATALTRCQTLLKSPSFQRSVQSAASAAQSGESLVEALSSNGLVLSSSLRQVLVIAETSGRWQQAIQHELGLQKRRLNQRIDNIFDWLPRAYYVFVLMVVLHYLL